MQEILNLEHGRLLLFSMMAKTSFRRSELERFIEPSTVRTALPLMKSVGWVTCDTDSRRWSLTLMGKQHLSKLEGVFTSEVSFQLLTRLYEYRVPLGKGWNFHTL